MRIQSLLFARSDFTPAQAKTWAKKHGRKYGDVDVGPEAIHLRQEDPHHFDAESFRTITIRPGVQARVGCPKPTVQAHEEIDMSKKKNRRKNPMSTGAKVGIGVAAVVGVLVLGGSGFAIYRTMASNAKAKLNPTTFIAGRRYDILITVPLPIPPPKPPSVADAQKALDQLAPGSFTVLAVTSGQGSIAMTVDVLKDTAEPAQLPPPLGKIATITDKGITPKGIVSSMTKPMLVARVG